MKLSNKIKESLIISNGINLNIEDVLPEIEQLERKIDDMKCCGNCKYEEFPHMNDYDFLNENGKCKKCDINTLSNWKLK